MKRARSTTTHSMVPLAVPGSATTDPQLLPVLMWLNRRALATRFPQWSATAPAEDETTPGVDP